MHYILYYICIRRCCGAAQMRCKCPYAANSQERREQRDNNDDDNDDDDCTRLSMVLNAAYRRPHIVRRCFVEAFQAGPFSRAMLAQSSE